jgi:tetratricopeptide (TPR) repeat protein
MNLSLCMIVRDEASNLPACLKSVEQVVDEMIVVDTGSTDCTIAIAQSFGAQVHLFDWCDDFAAARNVALKYAQGDWVLVLDADETLISTSISGLKQAIQAPNHLVVNLLRAEIGASQAPYSLVSRLFRNHPEISFAHPYHESIDDSVECLLQKDPRWRVIELSEVAIQHTGYSAGAIAQRQKIERARRIMERYLGTHPNDAYLCNKLGALYAEIGELEAAIALLQRGLKTAERSPSLNYELHYHLGDTYRQQGELALAETHYQQAVAQPIQPRLKLGSLNNWGSLRLNVGDAANAKALFEQVVAIDPNFAVGHYNLGMALKQLGNLTAAIAHYQKAIALQPTYAEAYQNLAVAQLKLGQISDSLEAFHQAIALHAQQNPAEAERLRQGLKEMQLGSF